MFNKIREYFSIRIFKNPGRFVLITIFLVNVFLILISALVISSLSLTGTEHMSFWAAAYHTITMILDAGCIDNVVQDIGTQGVFIALFCLIVTILGMVLFTGAIIGYITNYISSFIDGVNVGNRRLYASNHFVILNWNSRACEIINDLLYKQKRQKVVVLVSGHKKAIEKEIQEKIQNTIEHESKILKEVKKSNSLSYFVTKKFKNKLTVIVKEGDIFSTKQLNDISLANANTIVVLGKDRSKEDLATMQENSLTIKTLVQVADITSRANSYDNQKIIVEVEDDWTLKMVEEIKSTKQVDGKCNISIIKVNEILGSLLSQFSIMPELSFAYSELFSNMGASFETIETKEEFPSDNEFIEQYLRTHKSAIPLMVLDLGNKKYKIFSSLSKEHISREIPYYDDREKVKNFSVELVKNFQLEKRNIIILGHNSNIKNIMDGFNSFRSEWNLKKEEGDILNILVIDDKTSLEKMNYYKDYSYVSKAVECDIFDQEKIIDEIYNFTKDVTTPMSVLILSDDNVVKEQIDSSAISYLITVRSFMNKKINEDKNFNPSLIDVVVEILDPKHYDIVKSYSINNVVMSNKYISKMITQVGEDDVLFDFYNDILSYDVEGAENYCSKEIYIKKVKRLFTSLPKECTADMLVNAVYGASVEIDANNPALVIGYVEGGGKMMLFEGDLSKINLNPSINDKLIIFTSH